MRKIAITTGDPAGIGPEIVSKALRFLALPDNFILIVYGKLISYQSGNKIKKIDAVNEALSSKMIYWKEIDESNITVGKPTRISGETAYKILKYCANDLKKGWLDAVVTGPVCKEAIQLSQPDFIGHTEFFADKANKHNVIMSFWGQHFNLALLTTHLSTRSVSDLLTSSFVEMKLKTIYHEVNKYLPAPKMAMLAINPHAGENGAFGLEDETIKKVLKKLKDENITIDGPFPADTFFAYHVKNYNFIISAYHDQGLIPFKMLSSEEGVNVTLGLPFIRTSVDHGTAFDIAGKNIASEKSLKSAINLAIMMLKSSNQKINTNYSFFADYYDHYMAHVDYEKWVQYILEQFNQKLKHNPKRILELACGTATISNLLVKKKLTVDASDISEEMLQKAAAKPFEPNLFQHDMRNLLPTAKYDLVLLLFDSINYLLKESEILAVLENVYSTLQKKGLFIFDITTIKNCQNNFDGYVNLEDDKNAYLIHQGEFDEDDLLQTTILTLFRKKGFFFERFDEIHKQRIYRVLEMIEMINKTEFQLSAIHAINFNDNLLKSNLKDLDNNFTRLFFVLEKQ